MQRSAPKQLTFWIAVISVMADLVTIPILSGFIFWIIVLGFVIVAVGY